MNRTFEEGVDDIGSDGYNHNLNLAITKSLCGFRFVMRNCEKRFWSPFIFQYHAALSWKFSIAADNITQRHKIKWLLTKEGRLSIPTLPCPILLARGLIHLPTGLPELRGACYFPRMSTLSEIEAAVDKLPQSEQEILLEHLARKLGARPPIMEGSQAQRERWLQKLDSLRSRGFTGKTGAPLQEILDDIRAERC